MPTLLSLMPPAEVIMAAYGDTSDTKVAIMMDLSLLWYPYDIMSYDMNTLTFHSGNDWMKCQGIRVFLDFFFISTLVLFIVHFHRVIYLQ